MVHIVLSRFGEVSDKEINRVLKVMEECYCRLEPHEVELVDLFVFERSSSVEAFLTKEFQRVGVVSAPFDELFFATHDAWCGTPRITLCFEKMRKLPKLVQIGGVRHEVGHSVLHGSLCYYLLPFSPTLLKLISRFNLSREYATNVLYLISIAAKDYEVSHLLCERGYVEDQVAYAKYLLTVSESDVLSWEMSQGRPLLEILCLISCLKTAGCSMPLLPDKAFCKEMKHRLEESLSYLPVDHRALLLEVVWEGFSSFGTDTFDNVNNMVRKCKLIFEKAFGKCENSVPSKI
ncbi:MAG: hypothetical protein JSV15_04365 [Candidatus Bathyarchaeota archaeon]|nr:MAG: hypothetical protein JSV15_04365 [Candidatus Bathyarchaeota archaeon]